jgi:hypothetical protein
MVADEETPPSKDQSINNISNNDSINSPTAFDKSDCNNCNNIKDGDTDADAMKSNPPPSLLAAASAEPTMKKNRSINSYYGHKVGALHTISLVLSVGLILYAHIGLSAVILSSRDPQITIGMANNGNGAVTNTNTTANNGTATSSNANATGSGVQQMGGGGLCNNTQQDKNIWTTTGGMTGQADQSVYCSTVWNGGCFLNTSCVDQCFQEEYGYSLQCSTCFGLVPVCGVKNDCIMVW